MEDEEVAESWEEAADSGVRARGRLGNNRGAAAGRGGPAGRRRRRRERPPAPRGRPHREPGGPRPGPGGRSRPGAAPRPRGPQGDAPALHPPQGPFAALGRLLGEPHATPAAVVRGLGVCESARSTGKAELPPAGVIIMQEGRWMLPAGSRDILERSRFGAAAGRKGTLCCCLWPQEVNRQPNGPARGSAPSRLALCFKQVGARAAWAPRALRAAAAVRRTRGSAERPREEKRERSTGRGSAVGQTA